MMLLIDYPFVVIALFDLWTWILLLGAGFLLIQVHWLSRARKAMLPLSLLLIVILLLLYDLLTEHTFHSHNRPEWYTSLAHNLPLWLPLLFLPVITAVEWISFRRIAHWEERHMTPLAIKESLDALPVGLCYYTENGRVRLINREMESMLFIMTGHPQPDIHRLIRTIHTTAPDGVFRLVDGRILLFSDKQLEEDPRGLRELMAIDITSRYAAAEQLEKQNTQIQKLNNRLREVNETITTLTIQQEILAAKARLHNDLGALSLASRLYIEQDPDDLRRTREDLLSLWNHTYALLEKQSDSSPSSNAYEPILQTAADIGFTITIDGVLPQEEKAARILSTAMHECMVNAIRHAQASELTVRVLSSPALTTVQMCNNGAVPSSEIVESGGLSHLRSLAEHQGYTMQVQSLPFFQLTISIPTEVPHDL